MFGLSCAKPTRARQRGLTLAEVLISSVLFLLVTTAVLFTLQAGRVHQKKAEAQSDDFRACLLAAESLRGELESAWVLSPLPSESSSQLSYRVPARDAQGKVLLGPNGDLTWSATRTITLSGGKLRQAEGAEQKILSDLSLQGSINFERTSPTSLSVQIVSWHSAKAEIDKLYRLENQF